MSWSSDEALTDPAIRDAVMFVSEFKFCLAGIDEEITCRLYRPMHSGKLITRRSHYLVVDGMPACEPAARDDDNSEGEALHRAVDDLVRTYNAAKAKGLTPSPSWLKANPEF